MRWILLMLFLLAAATPGLASDGALEISHACAVQTGCFAGDTPGYPVTVSAPGSYRLTGNLTLPDDDTTAIEVASNRVTIDLGGFGIVFPGNGCEPGSCVPGLGDGIARTSGLGTDVTVRNGFVHAAGRYGILLSSRARVRDVTVTACGADGIAVGGDGIVSGNLVAECGGYGLSSGSDTILSHNSLQKNALLGGSFRDRLGGVATIGNACSDGSCGPAPRERRYYLTQSAIPGTSAADAGVCATGFHYASFGELADPSHLEYDTVLGRTLADSGDGPPSEPGWARSGGVANTIYNCNAGTAGGSGGFTLRLWSYFTTSTSEPASPWIYGNPACSNPLPAWCIED